MHVRGRRRKNAFTMIELMIVLVIVGILAAAAVPIYRSFVSRAYTAEIISACSTVKSAAELHKAQTGDWPADVAALENAGLLSSDDFANMTYVTYDASAITLDTTDDTVSVTWDTSDGSNGVANLPDDFEYASVTLNADGSVSYTSR